MKRAKRVLVPLLGAAALPLASVQVGSGDFPKPTKFQPGQPYRRYYRDLSEEQIKKVMKEMAAEIGVKCTFCHNEKDYTSEAIPMKDFARKKIGMVRYLNEKYRPEGSTYEYSCYSCHRGQVKPVPSEAPPPGTKKF